MAKPSTRSDGEERKKKKLINFFLVLVLEISTEKEIRQRQYKKLLGHATTTIIATLVSPSLIVHGPP